MSEHKHFDTQSHDEVIVVRIKDHEFLDRLIGSELQEEMVEFVTNEQPSRLLVSFERVQRFSSETINALLRAREIVVAKDGKMKLCEMRPQIRNVFRVLNLENNVFEIYDTADEAVQAF